MDTNTLDLNSSNQARLESLVVFGIVIVTVLFLNLVPPLAVLFRRLVTFIHELGHALVTLMTGGKTTGILVNIEPVDGVFGENDSDGGNRYLILSAGYLAPIIFSSTLILSGAWPYLASFTLVILGLILIVSALNFGVSVFTRLLGIGFGALFIWVALRAELFWSVFWLFLVALQVASMALTSLGDLGRALREYPQGGGSDDASRMASLFKDWPFLHSPRVWVNLWGFLSIVLLIFAVWFTLFRGMTA